MKVSLSEGFQQLVSGVLHYDIDMEEEDIATNKLNRQTVALTLLLQKDKH